MLAMYEIQMLASYEKARGRTLHGEELSALSFWLIKDTEKQGHLDETAMSSLFQGLRFSNVDSWKSFRKEFSHSIESYTELRPNKEVLRFDLMRQIFLDRGL